VRYRAFVFAFAAPQQFVAGNALDGMPGSRLLLVRSRLRAAMPVKKFLRPFEGVSGEARPVSTRTNRAGQQQAAEE